jgi:cytochrome d ubiquinol oxidase subunit II
MLIGLIFRGVAFEFRLKAREGRRRGWDLGFALGSTVAAFTQGLVLGAFVQGIPVRDGAYAGTPYGWFTAFSIFTGAALVVAYALLGATWLVMRTGGSVQSRMRAISRWLAWALLIAIGIVSVWTPLTEPGIAERWFSLPNLLWFSPVPLLVAFCGWQLLRSLARDAEVLPFLLTLALVFLAYSGLGISLWPNIVPPSVTVHDAAAPEASLGFALVGALAIVPVILVYTAWSYWVFRGKVDADTGYH